MRIFDNCKEHSPPIHVVFYVTFLQTPEFTFTLSTFYKFGLNNSLNMPNSVNNEKTEVNQEIVYRYCLTHLKEKCILYHYP